MFSNHPMSIHWPYSFSSLFFPSFLSLFSSFFSHFIPPLSNLSTTYLISLLLTIQTTQSINHYFTYPTTYLNTYHIWLVIISPYHLQHFFHFNNSPSTLITSQLFPSKLSSLSSSANSVWPIPHPFTTPHPTTSIPHPNSHNSLNPLQTPQLLCYRLP